MCLLAIALVRLSDDDRSAEAVEAVEVAQRACAAHPTSAEAHAVRAEALHEVARTGDAIDAAALAVELDPVSADRWVQHAYLEWAFASMLGRGAPSYDDALVRAAHSADRGVALAPASAEPHFVRALVHAAAKEYAAAEAAAARGLAIDPEHPMGHTALAVIHGRRDRRRASDHAVELGRIDPHTDGGADLISWIKGAPWWWAAVAVLIGLPVLSALDGSFEGWMWGFLVAGICLVVALRVHPRFRVSNDARAAHRRRRRLG